jgi:putative hemolysin
MITLKTAAWIAFPLLLLEAFFAGSEIALLSADKLQLKTSAKKGSRSAQAALDLCLHPERVLATTLLLTSLCMITISGVVTLAFISTGYEHAELGAIAVSSPAIVILGELIPKTLFQRNAQRLAPWVAPVVRTAYWILLPLTWLLSGYTQKISRILGPIEELMTGKRKTTREELREILSFGRKETDIKTSEKRMIRRIFDFKGTEAKHALIPLVRVEAIEEESTVREALEKFRTHRHSRMPVYASRIDNIIGVLEISDLSGATDLEGSIRPYLSPANYVPETQSLEDLLRTMNEEDNELAVVVDEYGGAIGILTLEDIVEEIVGEIQDEYDTEDRPYRELSQNEWLIQARAEIPRLNEGIELGLPEGDYETLGGFLLQQFGRIPEAEAELFYHTQREQLRFLVKKASARAIELVLVTRQSSENDEGSSKD